jgi:formylglycine-generating enzyme required for sulfatase activity
MSVIISKERIEKTISNLHYTENSVKRKFIDLIFQPYEKTDGENPDPIETDNIIRHLWDVNDSKQISYKRKNFYSLKTSINNDFNRLYKSGLNPDGIVIGDENIFDLSNEARETIFSKFSAGTSRERSVSLEELFGFLEVINRALQSSDFDPQNATSEAFISRLDQILQMVMEQFSKSEDEEKDESENEDGDGDGDGDDQDEDEDYEIIEEVIEEIDEDEDEDEEFIEEEIIEEEEDEDVEIVEEEIDEFEEEEEEEDEDEEVIDDEEFEEEVIEEDEELVEVVEGGLPIGTFGRDENSQFKDDNILKDRLLLEENLDGYLGAMERFYNQYLLIDEGKYIIGAKNPEKHEKKRKRIFVNEFHMGKFPVTNLLFSIFINKTGYVTTAERLGYGMVYTGRFLKQTNPNTGRESIVLNSALSCKKQSGACWHRPLGIGSDLNQKRNHPVVQVSIEDAMEFAKWADKRIPKEIEWEAGSRTFKGYVFPWGNKWKDNRCNIESTASADTTPVDKYQKWENSVGIVDALGNVLEWTCSKKELNEKKYYIAKGGSWISSNKPYLYQRSLHLPDYSSNIIGFRCVV